MSKSEKAREIIKRYPHSSKKELGRLLYTENPILFSSPEDARSYVRFVTGTSGKKNRATLSTDYKGPLSIPRGEKNDYSHYKVTGKRIGILADIHIPYHDYDALDIAINELKKQKIDTLILDGDIIDCYHCSDYVQDPNKRNMVQEVLILCQFVADLQKIFPKVKIIYKIGNHEERWDRYVMRRSPAIWGFECFEFVNLVKIEFDKLIGRPLDIDFVGGKRIIDIGKLGVVHGHEWRASTFSPVNPARGYFLRAKASVIGGDKHRTSEHTEPDMNGKLFGAWSIGCLCDLHPEYMPLNMWNLGFCFVLRSDDDSFEVRNYKIIDGQLK